MKTPIPVRVGFQLLSPRTCSRPFRRRRRERGSYGWSTIALALATSMVVALSRPAMSCGASYQIRDARMNAGGGRQSGGQFAIPCASIAAGQGKSTSPHYVIQMGCGTLQKALVDAPTDVPAVFLALPSAPNPFVYSTTLEYQLPAPAQVGAEIFDAMGRFVRSMRPAEQTAGHHTLEWDGRDDLGRSTPVGLYLLRFRAGQHRLTQRIVKIK